MTQAMHMITALDQQDCDGDTGYVGGGDAVGEEKMILMKVIKNICLNIVTLSSQVVSI